MNACFTEQRYIITVVSIMIQNTNRFSGKVPGNYRTSLSYARSQHANEIHTSVHVGD